jgi:hypothetical protein
MALISSFPSFICEDESRLADSNGALNAANKKLIKTKEEILLKVINIYNSFSSYQNVKNRESRITIIYFIFIQLYVKKDKSVADYSARI